MTGAGQDTAGVTVSCPAVVLPQMGGCKDEKLACKLAVVTGTNLVLAKLRRRQSCQNIMSAHQSNLLLPFVCGVICPQVVQL